jgi:hypothetical protein
MLTRWWVVLTLILVSAGDALPAAARPTSVDLVESLDGKTIQADQPALRELFIRQRAFTAAVLAEMKSPTLATRAEAIYLLGAYQIPDGVTVLMENIDLRFTPPEQTSFILAPPPYYPAVWALTEIGMPSVHAILKALPREGNAHRRKLMVQVLVGVEGADVTRFRLKQAIAQATAKSEKANLNAALAEAHPPKFTPPPAGSYKRTNLDP